MRVLRAVLFVLFICATALTVAHWSPGTLRHDRLASVVVTTTWPAVTTAAPTTTTTVAPTTTTEPPTSTSFKIAPPVTATNPPVTVPATVPVTTPVPIPAVGDDTSVWIAIGRCEQPGPQWQGVYWNPPPGHSGGPSSTYPGGLGIYSGAWNDYHAEAGVAQTNGAYGTPAEQMAVARVIRAHAGMGAWGCSARLGF